jgi:hypothetical protein
MSGRMIEDEDLVRAAEYALTIVRRTQALATADGLDAEYQAALVTLTAYVKALQTATLTSRDWMQRGEER